MAFTVSDVNTSVRYFLGGIDEEVMTDEVMDYIINIYVDQYSLEDEDFCIVTYKSLIAVLRYLIRQEASDDGSTGSGEVTRRREKRGLQEVELQYDIQSSTSPNGKTTWQDILDDYLAHPEYVCASLINIDDAGKGIVIIGGVSQKEAERVESNPDRRTAWSSMGNICQNRARRGRSW